MKTQKIYYLLLTLAMGLQGNSLWSQSANQNYIQTKTYTSASTTVDRIDYYDGLGRPVETVRKQFTPLGKDLVSRIEYDTYDREVKQWLPSPNAKTDGTYNGTTTGATQYGDTYPYSETVYEPSPLNRVKDQYGPGQSWRTNSRKVTTDYVTNSSAAGDLQCRRYSISGDNLYVNGSYGANELYVTKVIDENNTISYEFTDKLGQVLLQRQLNGTVDTYFVYDDYGNLRYVLPPLAADATNVTGTTYTPSTAAVANYAYIYKYDHRNRCTAKKLPGAEWVYMVYDKADRLRMSQDGVQQAANEWTYYKYDRLGRQVVMGILKKSSAITQATMVSNVNSNANLYETLDTLSAGSMGFRHYTAACYPGTVELPNMTDLQVNFYDNYKFSYSEWTDYFIQVPAGGTSDPDWPSAKGLLTGSRSSVPGRPWEDIRRAWRYNSNGQVVQHMTTNLFQYAMDRTFYMYNYLGQPIQKLIYTAEHCNSPANYIEKYVYGYDSKGRMASKTYQLNSDPVLTTLYTYDEFCRSRTKQMSNSETTTYSYNVRSWLTELSGSKFSETLCYNQPNAGATARFNGDISEIQYKTTPNAAFDRYVLTYDGMNRLTNAVFSRPGSAALYSEQFTYDKMGNITTLTRNGRLDNNTFGQIDVVTYSYTGNRAMKITDTKSNQSASDLMEFRHINTGGNQYAYDVNGRMTTDFNKRISNIQYNFLHLPRRVDSHDNHWAEFYYDATGVKQEVKSYIYNAGTLTKQYRGNKVYENNVLKMILTEDGYVEPTGGSFTYYFFIRDHLGNSRVVADKNGTVAQVTNYYPFGLSHAEVPARNDQYKQPYKYNGNELYRMFGYDSYDYSARIYNPATGRFMTMDPLAEKYYAVSPYAYALNNPVRYVDPDGRDVWDFLLGFLHSVNSNLSVGAIRPSTNGVVSNANHYNAGRSTGDVVSVVMGAGEMIIGGSAAAGGAVATVGTAGTASPVSVPAVMAGSALAGHGAAMTGKATASLMTKDGHISQAEATRGGEESKTSGIGSKNTANGDKMGSNTQAKKQVDKIAKDFNINRKEFGKYIEEMKKIENKGGADNYSWKQLEEMAREFKQP